MNQRLQLSLSVCCIATWLVSAGAACAQPVGANLYSPEWLAAEARVVVRGVVDKAEKVDGSNCAVTLRVLEVLKGEPGEKVQFVCSTHYGAVEWSKFAISRQQVLVFLDDWQRKPLHRGGGYYAYTRFPLKVNTVILLAPDKVSYVSSALPVYDRNVKPQLTPAMLSETIRSDLAHRKDGELLTSRTIELPPELRGSYYAVGLTVPAEPTAEKVVDFATFKERFGREPPAERKPPFLRSQSGYVGVYALELMAADCDVVARGVIDDWCFVAATDDPTGDTCGVRLRVTESLKGGPHEHQNFLLTDARDLAKLKADRQEIVVFLRDRALSMPGAALGHQTRDTLWDDSVIVLDERQAEVLFADMTWHRRPDEILERLRFAIERDDVGDMNAEAMRLASQGYTGPPVFDFHPPASLVTGASIDGNEYSVVYLPVNPQLEANAQEWAKSENKDLRWLGARAMIYFKSDDNAAILRELLDDTAMWELREAFAMLQGTPLQKPRMLVRWEAQHVLNGWGYDIPKTAFKYDSR